MNTTPTKACAKIAGLERGLVWRSRKAHKFPPSPRRRASYMLEARLRIFLTVQELPSSDLPSSSGFHNTPRRGHEPCGRHYEANGTSCSNH